MLATPLQPPPQLPAPGRMGFPLLSNAKFHIIAVRLQFSGPPMNLLTKTMTFERAKENQSSLTVLQVVHIPLSGAKRSYHFR